MSAPAAAGTMPMAAAARTALPQVIIITGPTAVGKTAVGLELAKRLGGEVISADSVQVYRTLDVGSDKLPEAQRQGIPHHLIDVRDPGEDFSAGDFHDLAREAAHDIVKRGKVPIVVGGTGFYLRWFTHGKAQGPKTTPEAIAHVQQALKQVWSEEAQRQCVEELSAEAKWEAGVGLLRAWGDAQAAARILTERNNYYRLERALAVVHMTGKTLAELDIPAGGEAAAQGRGQVEPAAQGQGRTEPARGEAVPLLGQEQPDIPAGGEAAVQGRGRTDLGTDEVQGQGQQEERRGQLQHAGQRKRRAEDLERGEEDRSALQGEGQGAVAAGSSAGDRGCEGVPGASVAGAGQGQQGQGQAVGMAVIGSASGQQHQQQHQQQQQQQQADGRPGNAPGQASGKQRKRRGQEQADASANAAPTALVEYDAGSIGDGTFDFRPFFLHRPRTELYDRIAGRCEEMVFTGLLEEAVSLLRQGMGPGTSTAARAVGYRQAMAMLQRVAQCGGAVTAADLEQCVRDMIAATHKLVRSQMTWFRDDEVYRWLEVGGCSTSDTAELILSEIASPVHKGGCGSSGRLTHEQEQQLKRYRAPLDRLKHGPEVAALLQRLNAELLPELVKIVVQQQ